MLSICFDDEREWWVSAEVFHRLCDASARYGSMPDTPADFVRTADANGGLDLRLEPSAEALLFENTLRDTAIRELREHTGDATYRTSLEKLLALWPQEN